MLIFFLSFIPNIGAIISMIPPILLAYAQDGLGLAITIGLLVVVINADSKNVLQPMVLGVKLSVSPTVVFLSTMFWVFILGGHPGWSGRFPRHAADDGADSDPAELLGNPRFCFNDGYCSRVADAPNPSVRFSSAKSYYWIISL